MVGREGRNLILMDQQENGERRSGHRRPRMIRKGAKAENVEKMRAARDRCKTGYWQPHKQEEDRAERGKETEKRVR